MALTAVNSDRNRFEAHRFLVAPTEYLSLAQEFGRSLRYAPVVLAPTVLKIAVVGKNDIPQVFTKAAAEGFMPPASEVRHDQDLLTRFNIRSSAWTSWIGDLKGKGPVEVRRVNDRVQNDWNFYPHDLPHRRHNGIEFTELQKPNELMHTLYNMAVTVRNFEGWRYMQDTYLALERMQSALPIARAEFEKAGADDTVRMIKQLEEAVAEVHTRANNAAPPEKRNQIHSLKKLFLVEITGYAASLRSEAFDRFLKEHAGQSRTIAPQQLGRPMITLL